MAHNCEDPHEDTRDYGMGFGDFPGGDADTSGMITEEIFNSCVERLKARKISPCSTGGAYFFAWGHDGEPIVAGSLESLEKKLDAAGVLGPLIIYYYGGSLIFDSDSFEKKEQTIIDGIKGKYPDPVDIRDIKFPDTRCLNEIDF